MKNEQRAATGWNVESYRLRISRIIQNMDQEAILDNALEVERSIRDVTKRPRYFQSNEKMGLASGASQRHPDHFSCSWGPSRYWSPSMHLEFQLNRRGNHGQ